MPAKGHTQSTRVTQGALAQRLKVSTRSIQSWRSLPGAPKDNDYDDWKQFIADNDLGISGNRVGKRREEAMATAAEHRAELLALELAERRRESVSRQAVNAFLLRVSLAQKAVLYPILEREYPAKVAGLSVAEISARGREIADRICGILSRSVAQWKVEEATVDNGSAPAKLQPQESAIDP